MRLVVARDRRHQPVDPVRSATTIDAAALNAFPLNQALEVDLVESWLGVAPELSDRFRQIRAGIGAPIKALWRGPTEGRRRRVEKAPGRVAMDLLAHRVLVVLWMVLWVVRRSGARRMPGSPSRQRHRRQPRIRFAPGVEELGHVVRVGSGGELRRLSVEVI